MKYLLTMLLLPTIAFGQKVTLPKEVVADGPLVIVRADTDCTALEWVVLDPGISLIPGDLLKDTKTAVVITGGKRGIFRLLAYGAKANIASKPAICYVIVGDVPPTPVPPTPVPPDPVPPTPVPPSPAPIPVAGFRVLIVEETAERGKLTAGQRAAIFGKATRDFLDAKCIKESNQAGYWILDKDVNVSGLADHWRVVFSRERKSHPWLIVSNGKTGWEGPLPDKIEDTMALLVKYSSPEKK